jgi:ClpP class serine protease
MDIDSYGSIGVQATAELSDTIYAARIKKQIIASVRNALSGGYWIASAAQKIYAIESAEIGSIGAIMTVAKKDNSTVEFVSKQSPRKALDPETEIGRQEYQAAIDDLAEIFIAGVARNRNVSAATVASRYGSGGFMLARKALAAGMIDAVETLERTISDMKKTKFSSLDAFAARLREIESNKDRPTSSGSGMAAAVEKINREQRKRADSLKQRRPTRG